MVEGPIRSEQQPLAIRTANHFVEMRDALPMNTEPRILMSEREFHDAILKGGSMPIEMHRARLTKVAPEWEFTPGWKFASE